MKSFLFFVVTVFLSPDDTLLPIVRACACAPCYRLIQAFFSFIEYVSPVCPWYFAIQGSTRFISFSCFATSMSQGKTMRLTDGVKWCTMLCVEIIHSKS